MVLETETKITQSPNSSTQYITIPASIVKDSQYPFKQNEEVIIKIDIQNKKIEIMKKK